MEKKEEKILLSLIADRAGQCSDFYMMTNTAFLDMERRTAAEQFCRKQNGLQYRFYGGFPDAERCIALFLPDYVDAGEDMRPYFAQHPEENPLKVIRASVRPGGRALSHRDYLGSLLGLGLKRETIGDILAGESGADIVVLAEIAEFLLFNYAKAGRSNLSLEIVPIGEIRLPEFRTVEKKDTVASLRLDNLIASAFSLSRGKAEEAISSGLVFVNGRQVLKADARAAEGDKLVFRGKGKAVLDTVGGSTRKDRIFIVIKKYL